MGRLYRMLFAAAAALLAAAGCDKFSSRVEVEDTSFEVESSVYYSGDWQRKALGLKLASGEDGSVTIYYSIDGNEDLRLLSTSQKEFESGSSLTLSRKTTQVLLMPNLSNNRHVLSMEFVKDGVSRSDTLSFTVNQSLSLFVNPNESFQYTRFSVTGQSGRTTLAFYVDGSDRASTDIKYIDPSAGTATETGESFEVNFDEYQTWEFELPYLVAGDHTLTVTSTTSNETVESYTRSFTEPTRKAVALKFEHSSASGALLVSSSYNPAKVKFNVRIEAVATGTATYRHHSFYGSQDKGTATFTSREYVCDTLVTPTPDDAAMVIDSRIITRAMEEVHANYMEDCYKWHCYGKSHKHKYADITKVTVKITIKSVDNATPGETPVVITPTTSSGFGIKFRYTHDTWYVDANTTRTVNAYVTLNGHPSSWSSSQTL